MCGFFWQSNLICFLLNQRAHIFYKNSLFYLFIFLFSYLLNSAADHNIFIYQFSKTPSRKKKPTKKHISRHHTTLSWFSLQSLGCTFIRILASVQHCCTIIFIWGLNILEELEPSFLLSCHFPPLKVTGIWQAPSLDSQTTGGTWFQFLHPVISDSWDIVFLQG